MRIFDDTEDPKRAKLRPLYVFLLLTLAVGAAASLVTAPSIPNWYARLAHPAIDPPNWVFAPVWTTLYILMAIAAWRVWRITGLKSAELVLWLVQLALNFAWTAIFFAAHAIGTALIEVAVLDGVLLVTLILFWRRDRVAGLLMLPYFTWSLFATFLTHEFWRLNS